MLPSRAFFGEQSGSFEIGCLRARESLVVLLLSLSLAGMLLSSCSRSEERLIKDTLLEADALNENSDLSGLTYMQPSSLTAEEARRYGVDNPEVVHNGDPVYGYYYRYPYDSESRYLTQIALRGGDYHVFGISVGDDVTAAGVRLGQLGYSNNGYSAIDTIGDSVVYEKFDVRIHLYYDSRTQEITEIWITTNTHFPRSGIRY